MSIGDVVSDEWAEAYDKLPSERKVVGPEMLVQRPQCSAEGFVARYGGPSWHRNYVSLKPHVDKMWGLISLPSSCAVDLFEIYESVTGTPVPLVIKVEVLFPYLTTPAPPRYGRALAKLVSDAGGVVQALQVNECIALKIFKNYSSVGGNNGAGEFHRTQPYINKPVPLSKVYQSLHACLQMCFKATLISSSMLPSTCMAAVPFLQTTLSFC
jgi:hypothetical protein